MRGGEAHHIHKDIANHEHGDLVVVPDCAKRAEELVIVRCHNLLVGDALKVLVDHLLEALVKHVSILMEDHVVRVSKPRRLASG